MNTYRNETKMTSEIIREMGGMIKWASVFAGLVGLGVGYAVSGRGGHWWLLVLAVSLIVWVFCLLVCAWVAVVVSTNVVAATRVNPYKNQTVHPPPPRRTVPVRNPNTGKYEYVDMG